MEKKKTMKKAGLKADLQNSADSDNQLLDRFRQGDEHAATILYQRYVTRLQAMARTQCSNDLSTRVDAEDIVQSVFRSFFRRASRGDYQVPEGDELWKLLVVITLNKVRSQGEFHRAAKRDVRMTKGTSREMDEVSSPREDSQEVKELRMLIEDLLKQLPAIQQRMVQLRLEGYEFSEIAKMSGRSKRTVERVLQDFRQVLQVKLDEDLKR